jgi:hypothetical protein
MFINPLCVSFELDPIGEPLIFCGELAEGRLNRLNVGMVHVNRDRGSTGQAISLLVRDDSDYDEKSYSPLGRIKKETL